MIQLGFVLRYIERIGGNSRRKFHKETKKFNFIKGLQFRIVNNMDFNLYKKKDFSRML